MKKLLIIPILLIVLSCAKTTKDKETDKSLMDKSYFRHLRYLVNVKNENQLKTQKVILNQEVNFW